MGSRLRTDVPLVAEACAFTARYGSLWGHVGVLVSALVPIATVACTGLDTTTGVLLGRDRFKMFRVTALAIAAQMIELHSLGDRSDTYLI